MIITGYKYNTEQEAIDAWEVCDTYYGIPVTPDDITQNWIDYEIADLNVPQFWYFIYGQSLEVVLGTPVQFDVVIPPDLE